MASEKAYRIVLAGDAAVGKSSFLLRLCKNEFKMNSGSTLGEWDAVRIRENKVVSVQGCWEPR